MVAGFRGYAFCRGWIKLFIKNDIYRYFTTIYYHLCTFFGSKIASKEAKTTVIRYYTCLITV